jgi:hypothetical protein
MLVLINFLRSFMNNSYAKYQQKYNSTPMGKFVRQKSNAKARGIDWELTFDQWWEIWEKSGKWEQRGTQAKDYCMARKFDWGPYAVGNVVITTVRKNSQEGFYHKITT